MASAPASEADLASLPGAELVDLLRTTYRRADFDAVARVLDARDRRIARVEADLDAAVERGRVVADAKAALETALTDLAALRDKYEALLVGAHRRPRDGDEGKDEEMPLLVGVTATDPVHRDEPRDEDAEEGEVKGPDFIDLCSDEEEEERGVGPCKEQEERAVGSCKEQEERAVGSCKEQEERAVRSCKGQGDSDEDEEDTELLSQRRKRLRRGELGAVESGKGNGQGQSNSVDTLGNGQQKSSSARMDGPVARTGQIAGTSEDSKVAAFVQGRGAVKLEKIDGEMPSTVVLPSPGFEKSALQKGSSNSDRGRAVIGQKKGSSDGVSAKGVSEPPNGSVKMNTTPMVESSAKCGNKEVGTDMQKCRSLRQSNEGMVSTEGVPFEPYNGTSTSIMVKREISPLPSTITSHWESEGHMIASLLDDMNLKICMQAVCALHRQRKLVIGGTELSKIDACRATKLAEFLLDGDLQGPMIKTAENHDAYFLKQVALICSGPLYNIYRNKEDPYFC